MVDARSSLLWQRKISTSFNVINNRMFRPTRQIQFIYEIFAFSLRKKDRRIMPYSIYLVVDTLVYISFYKSFFFSTNSHEKRLRRYHGNQKSETARFRFLKVQTLLISDCLCFRVWEQKLSTVLLSPKSLSIAFYTIERFFPSFTEIILLRSDSRNTEIYSVCYHFVARSSDRK